MVALYEINREESFGRDGLEITRTLRIEPMTARGLLIDALLGGVRLIGGRLFRTRPARDPAYPWCFCTDVKITPFEVLNTPGSNVGLLQLLASNYSESATVVATYKTLDHEEKDDNGSGNEDSEKELSSETWDYSARQLTLPNQYWKWHGTDELLIRTNTNLTKTFGQIDYTIARHFCLRRPNTAMTQMLHRVNKNPFRMPDFVWPAETLRYEGGQVSNKRTNKGQKFYEIAHKFMVQPTYAKISGAETDYVGHNRIYRHDTGFWEKPEAVNANADRIYQHDEDAPAQTIRGGSVKGFALLFHPGAR